VDPADKPRDDGATESLVEALYREHVEVPQRQDPHETVTKQRKFFYRSVYLDPPVSSRETANFYPPDETASAGGRRLAGGSVNNTQNGETSVK
jgi:hypothetical protein